MVLCVYTKQKTEANKLPILPKLNLIIESKTLLAHSCSYLLMVFGVYGDVISGFCEFFGKIWNSQEKQRVDLEFFGKNKSVLRQNQEMLDSRFRLPALQSPELVEGSKRSASKYR
jgi:hypothetical protein